MPQKKIKNADYESRLLGSLLPLKNFLFVEKFGGRDNYSDRFEVQRATYSTLDDDDILNHQAFEYKDYNPNIVSVPLRATSGFMSYHYNPEDEFFGQRPVEFHSTIKKKKNTDVDKILAERTEDIHSVIQTSKNYMIQTQVMRDKIIFGVGGKTIDEDDYSLAKFNYYPPECLAYGSSSGLVPDIFGVKEKMTPFSIRMRFEGVEDEFERRPLGIDEQRIECYRFNVPKDVLKAHFEAAFSGDYDYKQMKKYWQKRFKISSGKTNRAAVPWVDFWFCDKAILAVSERATRNIIVSPFSLPTAAAGIGKGLGEIVQPLAFILAEIESIGLVAFERTYQPSYAIHEETAALGLDLSRDGMTIFSGDNRHAPQDLSLRANMQGVIEYKTLMESHYEKNFFLDVFDLINKSRMTRQEVSVRTMDNLRKAGLVCDLRRDTRSYTYS